MLELAKKITKTTDPVQAKFSFIHLINGSNMYYNDGDIPANESDKNAHKLCSSVKDAERYCPNRTAAMKNWFAHSKQVRKKYVIVKWFCNLVTVNVLSNFLLDNTDLFLNLHYRVIVHAGILWPVFTGE